MPEPTTMPDGAAARQRRSLFQRIESIAGQAWFSYLMLALLQLKVVWGFWDYREITTGDTAVYHFQAWQWHETRQNNFAWSPLYTAYYGTVLDAVADPVAATLLHRLLVVFAAGAMALAVLRRLASPGTAWLAAAWWAALPINFDTLYEVHLFSLLPVLAAWLLAARPTAWGRAGALAVLAASTVLVRNELAVATGLWAAACAAIEWRAAPGREGRWPGRLAAAYGLPVCAAALLVVFFYSRSLFQFPLLSEVLREKHTVNMAQVYCFGYQQRHPEWTDCPWTDHRRLMTATFGAEKPTLGQMMAANPRAVAEHFAWNLLLTPNGLQVLLFNATSGRQNPDYPPVHTRSKAALALSAALVGVWLAGSAVAARGARRGRASCRRGRGQLWLIMGCVAAVSVPVILTQRPRPSYLFPLGVTLMAVTAGCVELLLDRVVGARRAGALLPLAIPVLFVVVRPYYPDAPTPVRDALRALRPYQGLIARPNVVFVKGGLAFEVFSYVAHGRCAAVQDYGVLQGWAPPEPLDAYLARRGVDLFYLDQDLLARLRASPAAAGVFLGLGNDRWRLVGSEDLPGREWRLFLRTDAAPYSPGVPP